MNERIVYKLKEIEKQHGIKILFAIESGSRAWNMSSKDSDYDVRFVYARNYKEYLRINKQADVLMFSYDKDLKPTKQEGCVVDMLGFDIYKYIRMLMSSNPNCIEWLYSDIEYIFTPIKFRLRNFMEGHFNPEALYHHYKSMCKQNYLKYLKSGNRMTPKKYLYAMRGLVNALWVIDIGNIPPVDFTHTIEYLKENSEIIPKKILLKLEELIALKKKQKESDEVGELRLFCDYIETFLKTNYKCKKSKIEDISELQTYVYNAIGD